MFSLVLFFVYSGVHGYHRPPLGGILSICESPGWLHGLKENVTGAFDHCGLALTVATSASQL